MFILTANAIENLSKINFTSLLFNLILIMIATVAGTDVLETQGKFVDRNITVVTPKAAGKITMKAGSGSVSAGSNCTLSTNNTSGISVTGSGSVTVETAVTTPGFLDSMTTFI